MVKIVPDSVLTKLLSKYPHGCCMQSNWLQYLLDYGAKIYLLDKYIFASNDMWKCSPRIFPKGIAFVKLIRKK